MPASYIQIAGDLIGDAILQVVEVTHELNRHSRCRIVCRQTPDRRFPIEETLGEPLLLYTVDQQGARHIIFEGFVLKGRLEYEVTGSFIAHIEGASLSYRLDQTPQEAYFRKKNLQQVAEQLAGEDGLTAKVRCPLKAPKNYVQWGETDFQFLLRLADGHGAWLRATGDGIEIKHEFEGPPDPLDWWREDGLLEFEVQGRLAPATYSGAHYEARGMKSTAFSGVEKSPGYTGASGPMVAAVRAQSKAKLPGGYLVLDPRSGTADEYKEALENESIRRMGRAVEGRGVSRCEALTPGRFVEIKGALDGNGMYGVTKVTHTWDRNGYTNHFTCTPALRYLEAAMPEPPPMPGAVPARVVAHDDPRKMGRVQVQYDWQEEGQTAWARMVTPHGGKDRGMMFMPEIGDEVLVMFEHGDPERPYVAGSLWNGSDHAPRNGFWGDDVADNDVKRIVTKSGHRIQMSDNPGREAITIATPRLLRLGLYEKAAETGRSMIVAHSEGDIFVSAPNGRIHARGRFVSRETGTSGAPPPAPAPVAAGTADGPPTPGPRMAAQKAALRNAAAAGKPFCEP